MFPTPDVSRDTPSGSFKGPNVPDHCNVKGPNVPDHCLLWGKNVSLVTCSRLLSSTPCYIQEQCHQRKPEYSVLASAGSHNWNKSFHREGSIEYLVGRSPISIRCIEYLLGLFKCLSKDKSRGLGATIHPWKLSIIEK